MAGYRAHIANLTRSITLRSANPNGVRAHAIFLHRADVDIRYAAFVDMGRTTEQPLDSHQPDRPLPGPLPPPLGPGDAAPERPPVRPQGSVIERSRKWPVAVHNSHYGLIEDNVAYDWKGAGFVTEDGSETAVIFRRNFALRGTGIGGRMGEGREGVGFWFKGTDVVVTDNVAANILSTDGGVDSAYGFKFYAYRPRESHLPDRARLVDDHDAPRQRDAGASVRAQRGLRRDRVRAHLLVGGHGEPGSASRRRARACSRTRPSGTSTTRPSSCIPPTADD